MRKVNAVSIFECDKRNSWTRQQEARSFPCNAVQRRRKKGRKRRKKEMPVNDHEIEQGRRIGKIYGKQKLVIRAIDAIRGADGRVRRIK